MNNMDIILEKHTKKEFSDYSLTMDVGGTATLIGIVGINKDKSLELAYSTTVWTKEIKSIYHFINQLIDFAHKEFKIKIHKTGISFAGPIKNGKSKLTHADLKIDIEKLKKKCNLKKAILMNDFEALGYSINIFKEAKKETRPIAVIGAGTGLGKAILIHDKNHYVPHPSEGGIADFPIRNEEDLQLSKIITKNKRAMEQEELVSGKGIEYIYEYLRKHKKIKGSKHTKKIDNSKEKIFLIEKYKDDDATSKEALRMFSIYFARIIKNFALETLPHGGIYLAGGIIIRNQELIGKDFFKELGNLTRNQQIIKNIDIRIIKQKDVSLLGAAYALEHS